VLTPSSFRRTVLALVLCCLVVCAVAPDAVLASATTIAMPEVPAPASVLTHANDSLTVAAYNCNGADDLRSTALSAVTLTADARPLDRLPKVSEGFQTQSCYNSIVAGGDDAVFAIQAGGAPNYRKRVVARRDGVPLWTQSFSPGELNSRCPNQYPSIHSLTMGGDGSILAVLMWPDWSRLCPERESLVSVDPGSGAINFNAWLPSVGTAARDLQMKVVVPYLSGVAVLNGQSVYYYGYDGTLDSGDTFTPSLHAGAGIYQVKVAPDSGRTFVTAQYYSGGWVTNVYSKDLGNATITDRPLVSGKTFVEVYAEPDDGYFETWRKPETGEFGLASFDAAGLPVYERTLSTETGASVVGSSVGFADLVVDREGDVIVRRVVDDTARDSDRNVIVDSFAPDGAPTRLFSTASLGGAGMDAFNKAGAIIESLDDDALYMVVCHATSYTTSCTREASIIKIDREGGGDLSRRLAFFADSLRLDYVALGDSFSSGEGNPAFLAPSDADGCHRSPLAYPELLGADEGLALRAFVACSGATTTDMLAGHDGEPSQLDSLNAETDVVTLTAGGDDIGFSAFAHECALHTCSAESSQYVEAMEAIDHDLHDLLTSLYEQIEERAPNAHVYVVGYPQIAPPPGIECTLLSNSEREAARNLVDALDAKIDDTVGEFGANFTFVDPTAEGSPFAGHEYCTEDSDFNGAEIPHTEYTFHPNALGHAAYAQLVGLAFP
jgi:lysophospholipase L1-like esterase